jgi:4'-phosphopantetheinyl transferase
MAMTDPSNDVQPVHVWWVHTAPTAVDLAWAQSRLTDDEWERGRRFHRDADRCRFVACRAVLRQILSECQGIDAANVRLTEQAYGKPQLADKSAAEKWTFNVAHSGDLGCVALARGIPVGVDVEATRRPKNLELMLDRVLSDNEKEAFEDLPPQQQVSMFLRYWTMKEALAKVTGLGLRLPLQQVEIDLNAESRLVRVPSHLGAPDGFHLKELESPIPGYFAAIAVRCRSAPRMSCSHWTRQSTVVGLPLL